MIQYKLFMEVMSERLKNETKWEKKKKKKLSGALWGSQA